MMALTAVIYAVMMSVRTEVHVSDEMEKQLAREIMRCWWWWR